MEPRGRIKSQERMYIQKKMWIIIALLSIISTSTISSSDDEYPKVSFMIRLLSVKIITVTFHLSQTIDEIMRELQSKFGLCSQYILKAGYKATTPFNQTKHLMSYLLDPIIVYLVGMIMTSR